MPFTFSNYNRALLVTHRASPLIFTRRLSKNHHLRTQPRHCSCPSWMQTLTPIPLRCVTPTPSTSKFQRKTWNWQFIDAGWILTQSPSSTPSWRCQPPLDLPWNLGKCLGEFDDASYHRDRKVSVCHHLGEISPSPCRPSLGPREASWKVWRS